MKTIEIICDEVAKEKYNAADWGHLYWAEQSECMKEVCKRYAIEVAKSSLEDLKQKVNKFNPDSSEKHSYQDGFHDAIEVLNKFVEEQNIVL